MIADPPGALCPGTQADLGSGVCEKTADPGSPQVRVCPLLIPECNIGSWQQSVLDLRNKQPILRGQLRRDLMRPMLLCGGQGGPGVVVASRRLFFSQTPESDFSLYA